MVRFLEAYEEGSKELIRGPAFCMGEMRTGRDLARHLQVKWRGWLTRHQSGLLRGAQKPFNHKPVLKVGSRLHVKEFAYGHP